MGTNSGMVCAQMEARTVYRYRSFSFLVLYSQNAQNTHNTLNILRRKAANLTGDVSD